LTRRFPLLIVAALMLLPMTGQAQEDAERKVHVLEQKPFLHALRVEVAPTIGYVINDVLFHQMHVGGMLRFHILDELAISGSYSHYVVSETSASFDNVQNDYSVFPEKKFVRWFAGGEIAYSPIYGKFVLFGSWTVHWNAYIALGAGVTQTGVDDIHFTGTAGLGSRFFLTDWMTLNFELKNHIYQENFKAGDEIVDNLTFQLGFGFFLPASFDYEFAK
jgi:outer membrane beta-barrel protein